MSEIKVQLTAQQLLAELRAQGTRKVGRARKQTGVTGYAFKSEGVFVFTSTEKVLGISEDETLCRFECGLSKNLVWKDLSNSDETLPKGCRECNLSLIGDPKSGFTAFKPIEANKDTRVI